jgi:hypothetical protein
MAPGTPPADEPDPDEPDDPEPEEPEPDEPEGGTVAVITEGASVAPRALPPSLPHPEARTTTEATVATAVRHRRIHAMAAV